MKGESFCRLREKVFEVRTGFSVVVVGRMPLASSRHAVMDRYFLADSRKMRPRNMLMQPMTKRKKAETKVKSSTWCDKI